MINKNLLIYNFKKLNNNYYKNNKYRKIKIRKNLNLKDGILTLVLKRKNDYNFLYINFKML